MRGRGRERSNKGERVGVTLEERGAGGRLDSVGDGGEGRGERGAETRGERKNCRGGKTMLGT